MIHFSYPNDVEFEAIKEDWNIYKLSDGATLKTKITLGKVISPPGIKYRQTERFGFNAQKMFIIYVPQSMKGTPHPKPLTPQEIRDSIVEDLDIDETIQESWNRYKLPEGVTIQLKLEITNIGKTDKFATDGTPIYSVGNQIIPRFKFPKGWRRKKTRKRSKSKTPIV